MVPGISNNSGAIIPPPNLERVTKHSLLYDYGSDRCYQGNHGRDFKVFVGNEVDRGNTDIDPGSENCEGDQEGGNNLGIGMTVRMAFVWWSFCNS